MDQKEYLYKGTSYKIVSLDRIPQDPTWFSHEDESSVRDRDWDIKPEDIVLDIGSAFGSYALTALSSGAKIVYCINYNDFENDLLKQSAVLNEWDSKLIIIPTGLYSRSGWLHESSQTFSEVEVEGYFKVSSLDDLDIKFERIDWLKLDVEGAEVNVLNGALKLINAFRPKLLIENHQFKDASIHQQVMDILVPNNYKLVSCHPYHGVSHALYEYSIEI